MLKRRGFETIDILKKDLSSRQEIKRAADHYFRHRTGLILPNQYQKTCGGCGRETYNLKTEIYMNEEFCKDCVDKWKHGHV